MLGVQVIGGLDHCDADDDGRKGQAVGDVDLDAAAGLAGKFLKGRAKEDMAKGNALKPKFIKLGSPGIRVDERGPVQFKRFRCATAFA